LAEKSPLQYLVVSALASNRPGIANQISSLVAECGCNIVEGKMQCMGAAFSAVLMISGEWNNIAKLEQTLPRRACELQMTTMMRRTECPSNNQTALPYIIDIVTRDNPGISKEITLFFAERDINIESMNCDTYPALKTGTTVGEIRMVVLIPESRNLMQLREEFLLFCEKRNIDANFEAFTR